MKKRFTKIISSILILAFLVSCLTVFVFADTQRASTDGVDAGDGLTLLINRTYDEGWDYANGFGTSNAGNHAYSIEYEETSDMKYNYFSRIESTEATTGYLELKYGANAAKYGGTILEFDIKTDDLCDFGSPILYFMSNDAANKNKDQFKLAGIVDNKLVLTKGDMSTAATPSYTIGGLDGGWVHLAFVTKVNQKKCDCGAIYDITEDNASELVCEPNKYHENEVVTTDMKKVMTTTVYFSYSDTFDAENAIKAPGKSSGIDLNNTYTYDIVSDGLASIRSYFLGMPTNSQSVGHSYCIDNVQMYNGFDMPQTISQSAGYGLNVDVTQAKTESIIGSDFGKTAIEYVNEGLAMKVNFDYCLFKGEKKAIFEDKLGTAYGAPVVVDGETYVPLQAILDWIGYPLYQHKDNMSFDIATDKGSTFIAIGRSTATVNGNLVELYAAPGVVKDEDTGLEYIVISKSDVEKLFSGYYVTYDDMGLIVISKGENLFNRDSDLDIMLDVMKKFIFTQITGQNYYDSVKETTNDFAHPYVIANQTQFDALKSAYNEATDPALKAYLDSVIADAEAVFENYTTAPVVELPEEEGAVTVEETLEDEEETEGDTENKPESTTRYKYLYETIKNPYLNLGNNGYTVGGRHPYIVECTADIVSLALAYQVTGNEKYSTLAYEMVYSLTLWNHWAPAYFEDCAEATANVAIAYDWLYNAWNASGFDLSIVESAIYKNGLLIGYNHSNGIELNENLLSNQGILSIYNSSSSSENLKCTAYVAIASLAMLGVDYINNGFVYNASATAEEMANKNTTELEYVQTSLWLLVNNFDSLIELGLDMYAPDGSFIESGDHWSQATKALMLMIWSYNSAMGTDLGLSNTWGLDKTFYYAFQIEYKVADGYKYWNYHEAWAEELSTDFAYYAAGILGDNIIAAIRTEQLGSKKVSIWDVLAYSEDYIGLEIDKKLPQFALDYSLEACEGIVSRSDWSENALYVGLMGNANDANGGQVDSGNFVYVNKGFTWFGDLGAENTDVYGYHDSVYRYSYYRNSAEGANTVIITASSASEAMPAGQLLNAGGVITDFYSADAGMYTILNNTEVYGGRATLAKRGMLVTNDRTTVVIQDEINFLEADTCAWVSQTTAEKIELSSDKKTAYLTQTIDGKSVYLRVSILEPGNSLTFSTTNAYTNILTGVHKKDFSTKYGAEYAAENDRDAEGLKKLVIKQELMLSFKCAIVFEILPSRHSVKEVEYEYTTIDKWSPKMITETFVPTEVDLNVLGSVSLNNIILYSDEASEYIRDGSAWNSRNMENFFKAMVRVYDSVFVFKATGQIEVNKQVKAAYELKYLVYKEQYDAFRNEANYYVSESTKMAANLCGYEY